LEDIYYVDGSYVPAADAVIPVNDLALLRGYGVFDFFRTYGGNPIFMREHIRRLENSAREVGIPLPWSTDELINIVHATIERNDHKESNVRVIVTGGPSPDFKTPQGKPRLLVLVTEMQPIPQWWYTKGVAIITVASERTIPKAKSIDYISGTIAMKKARETGAVEAVYTDRNGLVREGTTSNIFLVLNGDLVTPGKGILSGITRQTILDLSRQVCHCEIRDTATEALYRAEEIFISGSNKGLVPVIRVNDRMVADGRIGPITRSIMKLLENRTNVVPSK